MSPILGCFASSFASSGRWCVSMTYIKEAGRHASASLYSRINRWTVDRRTFYASKKLDGIAASFACTYRSNSCGWSFDPRRGGSRAGWGRHSRMHWQLRESGRAAPASTEGDAWSYSKQERGGSRLTTRRGAMGTDLYLLEFTSIY